MYLQDNMFSEMEKSITAFRWVLLVQSNPTYRVIQNESEILKLDPGHQGLDRSRRNMSQKVYDQPEILMIIQHLDDIFRYIESSRLFVYCCIQHLSSFTYSLDKTNRLSYKPVRLTVSLNWIA